MKHPGTLVAELPAMKNRYPSIHGALTASVVHQLELLLEEARRGEIIGLSFGVLLNDNSLDCGAAGALSRDRTKLVGSFARCSTTMSK